MAYQAIGRGTSANDGTGDDLRTGAGKVNANFVEVYTALGTGTALTTGISADANNCYLDRTDNQWCRWWYNYFSNNYNSDY